jgi:hypothetical protein
VIKLQGDVQSGYDAERVSYLQNQLTKERVEAKENLQQFELLVEGLKSRHQHEIA